MNFKKIYLLSNSAIKRKAVEHVFGDVECLNPGDTGCPQPMSAVSARQCIELRMKPYQDLIAKSNKNTIFIVIENYIYQKHDCVAILMQNGNYRFFLQCGNTRVQILEKHWNCLTMDIMSPYGSKTTLGQIICDNSGGKCPSNDWFRFINSSNPSRHEQIVDALQIAVKKYKKVVVE